MSYATLEALKTLRTIVLFCADIRKSAMAARFQISGVDKVDYKKQSGYYRKYYGKKYRKKGYGEYYQYTKGEENSK